MANSESDSAPGVTKVKLALRLGGSDVEVKLDVPTAPTDPGTLLPFFQSLTNLIIDQAVETVEAQGKTISCCKGCGACCRQLVPISSLEAERLRDVIAAMPTERQQMLRQRFESVRRRLEESGFMQKLLNYRSIEKWSELQDLGIQYFYLGIPCPFLEEESCSIHPDRPLTCREYLVTSPAEMCKTPDKAPIDGVPIERKAATALRHLRKNDGTNRQVWLPLSLAPFWPVDEEDRMAHRPGPEILRDFIDQLARFPGDLREAVKSGEPEAPLEFRL